MIAFDPGFPERALSFWFGQLLPDGTCDPETIARWWQKDADFDARVRQRFAALHVQLLAHSPLSQRPAVLEEPHARVAAIIVLDQFSRNMFRDTAAMYAADPVARFYALEMIALGEDTRLPAAYQYFVYMPLMHSEQLRDQQRCVELFEAMQQQHSGKAAEMAAKALKFAIQHRDIVAQWGRFPHRNELLGRTSSAGELEFLQQPGSGF